MAKAFTNSACLWHRRLSHLNFDYITLLSKKDIVTGLPKLKYVKDQLCSSCEMSKAKRSLFKSKVVPSSKGRLNLLHMDLCGPMRVASINGKKYILVIVDDYSRYTWTLFLRSKDETPEVLKDFLMMIQRNLQAQVITVRTDRGTELAPPSPDYIPGPENPQTPPVPQDDDEREPIYPDMLLSGSQGGSRGSTIGVETEDGPVGLSMDGGDNGDDDDGDSSRDDVNDEDEDDEDEEEEEEEALCFLATLLLLDYVRPQDFHIPSLEAEGAASAWCSAPHAHSPPFPPHLGVNLNSRPLRIASTQPPRKRLYLSTLGSRYEVGESSTARPTRGRGIDYGFVSTVDAEERRQGIRDVGYGIRDTWVDPAEAVPEIAPMTVGEVNTRVTELAELHEHDTQDLYALLEDAQDSRSRISQRVDMDSQRVDLLMGDRMTLQETVWMVEEEAYASREAWAHSIGLSQATHQELQTHCDHVYAYETHLQAHQTQLQLQGTLIQTQHQVHETRFQMQQAELAALRETDRRRQAQMAELLALREQQRRARQPGPEARIPDHQDASGDADSHI
ncbi:reverse transcriptase domain-containing protein [Tanacetum coccineum]